MTGREFVKYYLAVAAVLACTLVPLAQQAEAPKAEAQEAPALSETDVLKLDRAVLKFENTQLRIQSLQLDLQRQQTDLEAMLKALERPGYALTRSEQGTWAYVPKTDEASDAAASPPANR